MNGKRTSLIIGGLLSLLAGIVSTMLMLVYSLTQNNDLDYLFGLCLGAIGLGVILFIKASKLK